MFVLGDFVMSTPSLENRESIYLNLNARNPLLEEVVVKEKREKRK